MRIILLVIAIVVVVAVLYPRRSDVTSITGASSACEAKKRDFVNGIPQMTANRQPPPGMFISGGGFPPDSILVVEGNALWAQVLYDKVTGQATTWNVLCR